MFKTHENQVIAVFIEDRLYTCLQGNFPVKSFRQLLYGYIDPDSDGELSVKYGGKELDPHTTEIDISDGERHILNVCFRVKNKAVFSNCLELTAVHILKP